MEDNNRLAHSEPRPFAGEVQMLRETLIKMGRMLPGVVLHDDVSSDFLTYLPVELDAALATHSPAPTEAGIQHAIAEARKNLRLTQGCMECNAEDEHRWMDMIRWLEELA